MKPNHINFTEKILAALPIPAQGEKQAVYYDTGSKDGLCVIVTYGGTKTYYAYMKYFGTPKRVKIDRVGQMKLDEARKEAHTLKGLANKGKDPSATRRDNLRDMTLKDFYQTQYKPRHSEAHKRPASIAKDESMFKNYLSDFHTRKMITITRDELETWHGELNKKISPYMANRSLTLLSHMYNKAMEWGYRFHRLPSVKRVLNLITKILDDEVRITKYGGIVKGKMLRVVIPQ